MGYYFGCPVCGYLTKFFVYETKGKRAFKYRVSRRGLLRIDTIEEDVEEQYIKCPNCESKIKASINDVVVKVENIKGDIKIKFVGKLWKNIPEERLDDLKGKMIEHYKETLKKSYGIILD